MQRESSNQLWRIPLVAGIITAIVILISYLSNGQIPQSGDRVTLIIDKSFWGINNFIPLVSMSRLLDIAGVVIITAISVFAYQQAKERDQVSNLLVPAVIIGFLGNKGDLAIGIIAIMAITALLSLLGAVIGRKRPLMPLFAAVGSGIGIMVLAGAEGGTFAGILVAFVGISAILTTGYIALCIGLLIHLVFGNFSGIVAWFKGE
jgi:hypothetical protein